MAELLRVENLSAGYGEARVIQGLSFAVQDGQSLALLGRNGVGKTTLINSLIGATTRFGGKIALAGDDITALPPHLRARRGLGWTPQERNIFRSLTVEENLTAVQLPGPWTVKRVYGLFPRLEERRGNMGRQLSGGEQQMLAIGRALVLNPRLLLLDEPTEGLAPMPGGIRVTRRVPTKGFRVRALPPSPSFPDARTFPNGIKLSRIFLFQQDLTQLRSGFLH